jgi:hypothetical protein
VNDQYLDAGAATRTAGPVAWRWPSGLGQRPVLAVSGAAAVVMLGGVVAILSGHPPGTTDAGNGRALAAVSGCSALGEASGTLAQVNRGNLVIRTASGRLATVTTTAATQIAVSRASVTVLPATLAQLQVGANTIAVGHTGPGKTMSAVAVFQPPATPAGAQASVTLGGCSPSSIDRAITALGSAG